MQSEEIYRIDKFTVPKNVRFEIINALIKTHTFLRTLPGFKQDFIFENQTDPATSDFTTIVEWENNDYFQNAKGLTLEMQKRENYNPKEIIERNQIKTEFSIPKRLFF